MTARDRQAVGQHVSIPFRRGFRAGAAPTPEIPYHLKILLPPPEQLIASHKNQPPVLTLRIFYHASNSKHSRKRREELASPAGAEEPGPTPYVPMPTPERQAGHRAT